MTIAICQREECPMKNRICVLGGMNMDITGAPHASLCPGDSNPGTVRMTPGGVGRNIAENLARMGFQVELMAPLGNDGFATLLRQACMQDGIGLSLAPSLPMASSVYLCLMDGRGDMYAAVNDMALCESLSVGQLPLDALPAFHGVVLDANLPGPVLEAAARQAAGPLIADPVSAQKAERLLPLLPQLAAIKPNRMEAARLTGESDPAKAAAALCQMGVQRAFVSAGASGLYYCGQGQAGMLPSRALTLCNATGAGDSATAAIAAGCVLGWDMETIARFACRVAALTLQSPRAVSPQLTPSLLQA